MEEVSTSKNLTIQEREQLAQQLEDLRKETRTKEAQLAHERKQLEEQYEKKLTDEKKARETWELRYREGTTEARACWMRPSAETPTTRTR